MIPGIVYARPPPGLRAWLCRYCGRFNMPTAFRVFNLPEFECLHCGSDYFRHNDIDFCLADVKIYDISIIPNIMIQNGPECFSYACCQAIRAGYLVDTAFKNKMPSDTMLNMDPYRMRAMYRRKYCNYLKPSVKLPPFHKTMKILDLFWKEGIPLMDGTSYTVGDISFVDRSDFRSICELLANGEPVVASLLPGASISWLQYGQFYHSPKFSHWDMKMCNALHEDNPHPTHAVVLVGARSNHETREKGYWVINSWPDWCKRNVISNNSVGDIVTYGVGLIREEDLVCNAIKFWLPGERSAAHDPWAFRKEPEDATISSYNQWLYHGPEDATISSYNQWLYHGVV